MKTSPPRRPLRFLRWFCREDYLEEIEGDLIEVFVREMEDSPRKAKRKFTWSVLSYFRPGFIKSFKNSYQPTSFGMYKSYFKVGWRNILKSKVYSVINVGGLSIGMAATMLIILYVKDDRQYDTFHEKSPAIYRVVSDWISPEGNLNRRNAYTGNFQGPKFKADVPEIVRATRWQGIRRTFKIDNELSDQQVFKADPDFFAMFSFPFLHGNPSKALNEPNSIVITVEKARQLFNSTDVLGRSLELKGDRGFEPYQITGVVKTIPSNSSLKFDFVIPVVVEPEEYANSENWFNTFQHTFVELYPSADPGVVKQKMQQVYEADAALVIQTAKEKFNITDQVSYALQPLADLHLSESYPADNGLRDAGSPMYSYILSGIALFILVIACINFVNLSIARSLRRAREIGVRKAVGGSRANLTFQFLSESFLICLLAFATAGALVYLALPVFNRLAVKSILIGSLLDAELIIFYLALLLATGLTAAFYPALVMSRFSPVATLCRRFVFSGNSYLQKGLVVVQFLLSSLLIMATMTIYSQFHFMTTKDLGYDDKNLLVVDKDPMTRTEFKAFREALQSHAGILDVAPKNGGNWGTEAKVNVDQQISFENNVIDESYFSLLKVDIVEGRNFSSEFPADSLHSVLVSEAFVKEAKWAEPIGQTVNFWYENDKKYTVIGVVKDHHFRSLNREISPQLFTLNPKRHFGRTLIKIGDGKEAEALAHIEKTFKAQFPDYTYSYQFKEETNRQQYQMEARWKQIVLAGSILTIFLSCIGLFALATLATERRTKEIGIRKILGASISNLTQLLSFDFLKLVLFAFVLAIPVAGYASAQWLNQYAYRIDFGIGIVLAAVFVTAIVAFFPIAIQTVRVAMANPVRSLKKE